MNKKLILPISIILGCIILGGFVYTTQLLKQKSVDAQQQAELLSKHQADCYAMEEKLVSTTGGLSDYISRKNHYNTSLNKCFVEITTDSNNSGVIANTDISIFDAIEDNDVAECINTINNGVLDGTSCFDKNNDQISQAQFNSLEKGYMNN